MKVEDDASLVEELQSAVNEEGWVQVGTYSHLDVAQEHALVILAMGLPCWIEAHPHGGCLYLLVAPQYANQVIPELREYELEQKRALPTIDHGSFSHSPGWVAYVLWLLVLVLIHRLETRHPELVDLCASSSIRLVEHREFWRPFTALFFHADMEHLLSNLLSGLIFSTLLSCSMGALRGWLLLLTCGTIGNAITSIMYFPKPYLSIGASTAVFAALGILSGLGLAWMLRFRKQIPWLRVSAPVISGVIILGMTGSGTVEGNTDVMAHVFGFATGVVAGSLWGTLSKLSYTASCGISTAESDVRT